MTRNLYMAWLDGILVILAILFVFCCRFLVEIPQYTPTFFHTGLAAEAAHLESVYNAGFDLKLYST